MTGEVKETAYKCPKCGADASTRIIRHLADKGMDIEWVCSRCDYRWNNKTAMDPKLQVLSDERSKFYGDPYQSHLAIGMAWMAILRNHFQGVYIPTWPPRITALMMSVFKEIRAARPEYRADSYDDAHVYLHYAQDWHKEGKEVSLVMPKPPDPDPKGLRDMTATEFASQAAQGTPKAMEPVERRRKDDLTLPDSLDGDLGINILVAQEDTLKEISRVAETKKTLLHPLTKHYTILGEEMGEVGRAILNLHKGEFATDAPFQSVPVNTRSNLYIELIQLAATATIMAARTRGGAI